MNFGAFDIRHLSYSPNVNFKIYLTLTLGGTLLAGAMVGSFVEGTDEPIRQGLLLGLGVWLVLVGIAFLRADD